MMTIIVKQNSFIDLDKKPEFPDFFRQSQDLLKIIKLSRIIGYKQLFEMEMRLNLRKSPV